MMLFLCMFLEGMNGPGTAHSPKWQDLSPWLHVPQHKSVVAYQLVDTLDGASFMLLLMYVPEMVNL